MVLAKIRAFPYWPAVIEAISDDGIITVKFPDGKLGIKSLNEKIFENGKIFQYQEINESQEIKNHIAINLFTEKSCLSDICEIK